MNKTTQLGLRIDNEIIRKAEAIAQYFHLTRNMILKMAIAYRIEKDYHQLVLDGVFKEDNK